MMFRRIVLLLIVAVSVLCCARPASEEYFVKASEVSGGVYSFSLDLSDSLSVYDIYFFSPSICQGMEVKVLWTGPDGDFFSETAYMAGSSECELYRKDVSMNVPGTWKLDIRLSGEPEDFRGLGIVSKRHGTR